MVSVVVPLHPQKSWIAGFIEYTDDLNSPERFRKWAAITSIAAACERRLWCYIQGNVLYPNLYTFLVGPPGIGKSRAFHRCENLFRHNEQCDIRVAPVNVTKASFVDTLYDAYKGNFGEGYSSLFVAVGELSALLPGYDTEFLNTLTYLYDGEHYEERRRTGNKLIIIDKPSVTLLVGTTPGYLGELLPIGAWSQGFMARVVIVYADEIKKSQLSLNETVENTSLPLESYLKEHIAEISKMAGQITFTGAAAKLVDDWYDGKSELNATPSHPRLIHYNTRRHLQLVKLCMIAAVDRGAMEVSIADVGAAMDWLFEVEENMSDVFKAMTYGGDSVAIDDALHYIRLEYVKTQKPVSGYKIQNFLRTRLSINSVDRAFKLMISAGMIEGDMTGYKPKDSL